MFFQDDVLVKSDMCLYVYCHAHGMYVCMVYTDRAGSYSACHNHIS